MDTRDEEYEVPDFGWWPEIVGGIGVAVLIFCLLAFARGSI